MLLTDVICRSNTEYEIRFLLTAYLENLQARGAAQRLPPGAAALPLKDEHDIEARFAALLGMQLRERPRAQGAAADEIEKQATEIFGAAVIRLHTLRARETSDCVTFVPPDIANAPTRLYA